MPVSHPQPTTDLNKAQSDISQHGYCFIADALDATSISSLKHRLTQQAIAEKEQGLAFEDGGPDQNWGDFRNVDGTLRPEAFTSTGGGRNQRVWMLVNKGQIFVDMLAHPVIRALMDQLLGDAYLLSSHSANIVKPGSVAMRLHTDQWWMPAPTRRERQPLPVGSMTRNRFDADEVPTTMISPCVAVNVLWMLDAFTEENGGTHIVPGSHLSGKQPPDSTQTAIAEAPSGTALILDGRTWHGTGPNTSDNDRRAILTTFCAPQFRPQENYCIGTHPSILQSATNDLLALLGFKIWNAYGRIENPAAEFVHPQTEIISRLGS